MPLMEIVLEQTYAGQECINRWNYLASGTPAAVSFSFALVTAFGAVPVAGVYPAGEMCTFIAQLQDNSVAFVQIGAKDVYSNVDFYETPFTVPLIGANGTTGLSPATAAGFRTNRTRLDIRRGTKRFVGVPNGAAGEGGLLSSAYQALMANLAAKMTETLEYDDEGNTLSFAPVIVGKQPYVPDPLRPDRIAYRYYPTFAEQDDHLASSIIWDNYTHTRTQNSRQYGRGR